MSGGGLEDFLRRRLVSWASCLATLFPIANHKMILLVVRTGSSQVQLTVGGCERECIPIKGPYLRAVHAAIFFFFLLRCISTPDNYPSLPYDRALGPTTTS